MVLLAACTRVVFPAVVPVAARWASPVCLLLLAVLSRVAWRVPVLVRCLLLWAVRWCWVRVL
mgnify:CR=1 FL=1